MGGAWRCLHGRAEGRSRSDNVIAVVDLPTFRVVGTTHTAGLSLFEFHGGVQLDHDGFLLIDSLSLDRRGAFIRLAIPSLTPGPICVYNWVAGSAKRSTPGIAVPNGQHPEPQTAEACSVALGSAPFSVYSELIQPTLRFPAAGCDTGNKAEFCRWLGSFTADGRFGVAEAHDGHDNLFGNFIMTNARYIIFSSAKRSDVWSTQAS